MLIMNCSTFKLESGHTLEHIRKAKLEALNKRAKLTFAGFKSKNVDTSIPDNMDKLSKLTKE